MDPGNNQFPFKSTKWAEIIPLHMTYLDAFIILGNLQLSLRHPENIGPSAVRSKQIARFLAKRLIQDIEDLTPEIIEQAGWKEEFEL